MGRKERLQKYLALDRLRKKLLPTNCAIRNFEATVSIAKEKERAIALKKGILVSKDLDNRRLKYIIEEELKSMEQGTF
ncbi:MAG: hypothetical protein ACLU4J_14290 [Butyricimonas paravirosa]